MRYRCTCTCAVCVRAAAFLVADVSVKCSSPWGGETTQPEHVAITNLAIVMVVVYPVGLILLNGVLLYRNRVAIQRRRATASCVAIRFLWAEYERFFYWCFMHPCQSPSACPPRPPLSSPPSLIIKPSCPSPCLSVLPTPPLAAIPVCGHGLATLERLGRVASHVLSELPLLDLGV